MKKQIIIAVIVTAVVVGGGSFSIGMKYGAGSGTTVQRGAYTNGGTGNSGMREEGGVRGVRGGANGGFISGNIIAVDDKSITVALQNGGVGQASSTSNTGSGSRIIFVGASTQIIKTVDGTLKDLTIGERVATTGTANPDGSVTAQSIQIRPAALRSTGQ